MVHKETYKAARLFNYAGTINILKQLLEFTF